jgi:bifunctional enzyme CysN/CysC
LTRLQDQPPGGESSVSRRFTIAHSGDGDASFALSAARSDIALIVVDALEGLQRQARWTAEVVSLFSVPNVALVIDGMERIGFSDDVFQRLERACRTSAFSAGLRDAVVLPVSLADDDNVAKRSTRMPWYRGPALLEYVNAARAGGATGAPSEVADQFEATIVWIGDDDLLPGRPYEIHMGGASAVASFGVPKYRLNVDTREHVAARTLHREDIGVCNMALDRAVGFDPCARNRANGTFVVRDGETTTAVGVGAINFALRRAHNLHWQAIDVDKHAHAALKGHRPCIVWFTGLSGAGKSTIANLLEKRLHALGAHTYLLDGDNVRHGLNRDLGFTAADRVENIRRIGEVARLMVDAGLVVLVSFISPFRAERRLARHLVSPQEFCEVFVDAPLAIAEARDPKGLYRKARRGELANFTGIDSPYERPEHAEVSVDTSVLSPEESVECVMEKLADMQVLPK